MILPNYVKQCINILNDAGYEAVVVGGAVRDYLLGLTPSDYDISTSATPDEIKTVFKNFHTIDTGIKHGTVTVIINHKPLEITTYRYEEDYSDFRHPKKVVFIRTLKEDLMRRDFTINAICYDNKIIDVVGGIDDLNNKIIKCIGESKVRFYEDPLRILRALRFSSTLDFIIDDDTKIEIYNNFKLLNNVSKERINIEFSKLLLGKNVGSVLNLFNKDLEDYVLNIKLPSNIHEIVPKLNESLQLRLACLFINEDNDIVIKKLHDLKYPNKVINEVSLIIEYTKIKLVYDEQYLAHLLKDIDLDILFKALELKIAYSINDEELDFYKKIKLLINNIVIKYPVYKLSQLKVSGKDLIKIGFPEGIVIKDVLDKLLTDVLNGLENNHEVLIKKAKYYFDKYR